MNLIKSRNNVLSIFAMQTAIAVLLAGSFFSCGVKGENESPLCENMMILKKLNGEPAVIQKRCFDHLDRNDAFFFVLVNHHEEFFSDSGVFPIGEIPQEFRKEGLSITISGNVTSCTVLGGCSEPNIKLANIPLFELNAIKIKK